MDIINGLKNQFKLNEVDIRRLNSEYELIILRIDFCLHKFQSEKKNFYDLLVFYGGVDRFTQYLSKSEKNKLKTNIEIYNQKIAENTFDKKDRLELSQILFSNSDYVKDICNKVKKDRCFNYDIWNNEGVSLHFTNAVIPINPLKDKELENRKNELKQIAEEINEQYPNIKYFFSISWMWNLDVFQNLMPKEFNNNLKEFNEHDFYSLGHWGQFFRYDGSLNEKRIKEFRKNWKFPFKILLGECDKEKFFEMYLK